MSAVTFPSFFFSFFQSAGNHAPHMARTSTGAATHREISPQRNVWIVFTCITCIYEDSAVTL